ncbi:M67 family metallopeptidase [Thalassospira sp. HF15]|uniref:Mov34/MPN/PAD-1 family protein n=1 Tax=Thalassospira sp. HF15 TaxID=2722755 RepID=UPI0014308771|nr:M67 family metallopeptidase [Thalassospira sp. HF15]NIY74555.1 M67 family metallopeptidase [Thalassospira sp. HF15]
MTSDRPTGGQDQTQIALANALRDEIHDFCALQWPQEACGLLIAAIDTPNKIRRVVFARNVAEDPLTTFEIDPQTLIECHRTARHKGERVVGCFHSHPNGKALPSPTDRARADENGFLWLVIATEHNGAVDSRMYRIIHQHTDDANAENTELRYFRRCQIIED